MSGDLLQGEPYTTIDQVDKIGIVLDWNGSSPVGEFFVECSYLLPGTTDYTPWQALNFGNPIDISGNSGSHLLSIIDPPFQKMRLRYDRTSGSGSLTAVIYGASKGA
jgi:hypothetical protein